MPDIMRPVLLASCISVVAMAATPFRIQSKVFHEGEMIPGKFTCDGDNHSPPLTWSGPPVGTKSLALVVDDPDAPGGVFTHWMVWGIPLDTKAVGDNEAPRGARQGRNDFHRVGWNGPCPPPGGAHRYRFRLLALDFLPEIGIGSDRVTVDHALAGHVLAETVLTGRYARKPK